MIDLYTWGTPNGKKASIMLEEVGLQYTTHLINIMEGEQFDEAFSTISPNNKIPAIVDPSGPDDAPLAVFESGAILIYLAEKSKRRDLLPSDGRGRYQVLQWLMWQMGGVGPMLGQANHFITFAEEEVPYAITRYHNEALRLYGVLDRQLKKTPYLAGSELTIADIATFPWTKRYEFHDVDMAQFPAVQAWQQTLTERDSVVAGMNVPAMGPPK